MGNNSNQKKKKSKQNKLLRIVMTLADDKRTSGDITMPDLSLCLKAIAINIAWYWHKNGHGDQ